jgi:hypothetical protein
MHAKYIWLSVPKISILDIQLLDFGMRGLLPQARMGLTVLSRIASSE